jgi:phenylacetic acid degradation operon negative regulatory protein
VSARRLTAKQAILQLLSAAGAVEVSAALLVEAGELLGFSENNVRVTLARLLAGGTVEVSGRGMYRLGERALALAAPVRRWRDLEKSVRRWDGAWACAYSGDLPRSDRSALARRERVLSLLGFRSLAAGLFVRPDNLDGGVASLRERAATLLQRTELSLFRGASFDEALERRARGLWDGASLDASYRQTRDRISRWLHHAESLAPEIAAREAFLFGGDVLRQILFDPRLPEPLVDVTERRAMLESAKRLDEFGRRLWFDLFGMRHGLVPSAEEDHDVLALH